MTQDSSDFFLLFKEVPWMIVFICEAVLILTENVMTILIFWGMRKRLKRTSYLLINLAVADFFVGIGLSMFIGTDIARTLKRNIPDSLEITLIIIDLSATLSSVTSLALISLERMFAILWPFRHRLLKTRYFYVSIGVVWLIFSFKWCLNAFFSHRLQRFHRWVIHHSRHGHFCSLFCHLDAIKATQY